MWLQMSASTAEMYEVDRETLHPKGRLPPLVILLVVLTVVVSIALLSGWLDDRVEWLCDGVWIEKPNGGTNCLEGSVP